METINVTILNITCAVKKPEKDMTKIKSTGYYCKQSTAPDPKTLSQGWKGS